MSKGRRKHPGVAGIRRQPPKLQEADEALVARVYQQIGENLIDEGGIIRDKVKGTSDSV